MDQQRRNYLEYDGNEMRYLYLNRQSESTFAEPFVTINLVEVKT